MRGQRWADRLAAAVKRGKFTKKDVRDASNWSTCAVGEQPRKVTGVTVEVNLMGSRPGDDGLRRLGLDFMWAVEHHEVGLAVKHFHAIRRLVKVLR